MATDPAQNICLHYAFQFKSQWQKKLIVEVLTLNWNDIDFFQRERDDFFFMLPSLEKNIKSSGIRIPEL